MNIKNKNMNILSNYFLVFILFTLINFGSLTNETFADSKAKANKETVKITVDFNNDDVDNITKEVKFKKGMTAMDGLLEISKVKTEKSNEYIFVVAIDDIEAEKGISAWYYNINGNRAKKLASSQLLNPKDKINWVFEPDICTKKIKHIK